ncbi:MAG: class A beta-lactamase-related serine hydrolase, partial [Verrucomicrobiota bacterium]|nr:class A beta-lactamase-related serine hydrolase [Verrucomicrobiota bacterium]
MGADRGDKLRGEIDEIVQKAGTKGCAVAVHDLDSDWRFAREGDRLFHAASTIKVAILLALFRGVDEGLFRASDPLHVRNRFLSAIDETPFSLEAESDGYPQLYRSV